MTFGKSDIDKISDMLGKKPQEFDNAWQWNLHNEESKQSLVLSIHNEVSVGKNKKSNLISIQTQHGYFEMHQAERYLLFDPDEVIFLHYSEEKLSSLIIGRQCTCSMFTNINREILNADFASLDAPVLLSAMQLSITEEILP